MKINFIVFCILYVYNFIYDVTRAAESKKSSAQSNESCLSRVAACEANLSNANRPVCGTNRRNYPSKCHLLKVQCAGELTAVAHRGQCIEGQSSCLTVLRYALNAQGGRKATFVPRCRADGTYAAVQCAAGAASGCWCVTPDGKPLPDTAVRNGRPDCTRTVMMVRCPKVD